MPFQNQRPKAYFAARAMKKRVKIVMSNTLPAAIVFVMTLSWHQLASADSMSWLMRINHAASDVSFAGTFVYVHDNKIEAMEVARRVDNGMMQERLYALNGEAREIVRDMNQVWCFIPDQNVAVHDYRQASESGFPRILPRDVDQLAKNYRFEMGGTLRIADRPSQQIKVIPNDDFRYGYLLWADEATGLLLRSDLVDQNGKTIEQYLFVQIQIGGVISDAQLEAVTRKEQLELYGNANREISAPTQSSNWKVDTLPSGYTLSRHIRRMSPMEASEVEHMVFSDGLSTVSVFIKPATEGQSSMTGPSNMGAVNAFRNTVKSHRITVMGEVPAETVEMMAKNISYRP